MNAGAKANHLKACEIVTRIATLRSEGLTYKEVGQVLGISPNAVKQRFWRYQEYLRKQEESNGKNN